MKLKKKKYFKYSKRKSYKLYLVLVIIAITTYRILYNIDNRLIPHIENLTTISINKTIHNDLYYMFDEHTLGDVNLTDIIHLTKNDQGEVLTVDYRYDIAYEYLSKSMNSFYERVGSIELDIPNFKTQGNIIFIPLGLINSNNILFHYLGFKIPIKIDILNDISMKFKTKISEYGLNNLLVELYIVVAVNNSFLSPNNYYNFGEENELLIASKIVVGKIPLYYGETIEKESSILSS